MVRTWRPGPSPSWPWHRPARRRRARQRPPPGRMFSAEDCGSAPTIGQMPGPTRFPAFRGAVPQRAVVGRHRARTARGVSYLSFPSDLPTVLSGTQSGSVLVALTYAVALEAADLSVGLQRGFGGRRCSRFRSAVKGPDLLRPAWVPNRFDRRSPRILVDRPARADPAVTVDERRCALAPTRLGVSRRAGPRSLSHPCNATDLGRGHRTAVDEGSVRTAPADEAVPPRPWARSSACGTPLPPTRAGRTISSKRLRGTDSIPVFPQRVRRGTRDGPGSPTPLPAYSWCSSVLVLRHFGAAARHFGAGAQGRAHLSMGGPRNGGVCLVVAARCQLPGSWCSDRPLCETRRPGLRLMSRSFDLWSAPG